ncbi:putative glutamate carboxypeptidase AMP1 [Vitis vinifera]|uniref:glutamate carboxypeptidase II n=1 Tax=Vitis vinifera TaxID=29760 RepID=A0A438G787_VITVI|nr:putative glutamate carboxypeptidase AMP1 [Vitis vinifera]
MLWRKVIVGNFGEEPSEWCSWVAREGYGVSLWKSIRKAEKKIATIHNVFAVIRGSEEPDRYVLLGNHRDAWTYGAVDPNSGTAVLLDIARRYALMMRQGWQPRRTIVLCSWDAEEFGMIGSTEWVEQNLLNLGSKVVAYLNVDCAVQGPGFFAGATPQLDNLLIEVAKKVQDPDSESMTIYDNWMITNKVINIQRLSGVDSDFLHFCNMQGFLLLIYTMEEGTCVLRHACIKETKHLHFKGVGMGVTHPEPALLPSLVLNKSAPVIAFAYFPVYHTAFDSYNWMTNHGDPLFQRHVAVAGVWGLLALHLADDPILPFNYVLHRTIMGTATHCPFVCDLGTTQISYATWVKGTVSLHPITASIQELTSAAEEAEGEASSSPYGQLDKEQ